MAQADESVLDFPRDGLCPALWEKVISADGTNETWRLIPAVRAALLDVAEKVCTDAGFRYEQVRVWMTGSLTSNTYTAMADIDIHFRMLYAANEPGEDIQRKFKSAFDALKAAGEDLQVSGHPIEVYYQVDEFQDFMSVGCYDVKADAWLVGPELKDPSYNPYSELYRDIQSTAGALIKDIRNKILDVYEKAVVFTKVHRSEPTNQLPKDVVDTAQHAFSDMLNSIKAAVDLYENARTMRKVYSSPKSIEQALKYRNSKKWKIADASFKLMDKFGYLAILKKYKELEDLISTGDGELAIESAEAVLSTVKKYISSPEKLAEKDQLDEGLGKSLSIATVISFMAIPGLLPKTSLAAELKGKPLATMTVNSPTMKNAVANAATTSYNEMNVANIVNAIARTIFAEAQSEGEEGQDAIASVIWNRAGGKVENFIPVISKKAQFSSWRKYSGGWTDADYKYSIPSSVFKNARMKSIWDYCVKLATQLVNEEFTSTIGNRNMIANKKLDNKDAWDAWGKDCDMKIGKHAFGYDASQDGFRKAAKGKTAAKTYVVKAGDTLSTIAKRFNTSANALAKKNGIENIDKISIGQKLKV